jgi:hypothetical protein
MTSGLFTLSWFGYHGPMDDKPKAHLSIPNYFVVGHNSLDTQIVTILLKKIISFHCNY